VRYVELRDVVNDSFDSTKAIREDTFLKRIRTITSV